MDGLIVIVIGALLMGIMGLVWVYLTIKIKTQINDLKRRAHQLLLKGDWKGAALLHKEAMLTCIGSPNELRPLLTDLKAIYQSNGANVETIDIDAFSKAYIETFKSTQDMENNVILRNKVIAEMRDYLAALP